MAFLVAALLSLVPVISVFGLTAVTADAAPASPCPCSLFPSSTVPVITGYYDQDAVELGVAFYSDTAGYIDGIRFYKSVYNTGVHVGSLWTASGQLLAQATFTSESSSGWEEVDFPTPVAVAANTDYVASYHTSTGYYAVAQTFFTSSGYDNAPLHALGDNTGNPNGLFTYSPVPTFPTGTFNGNNYYVDVVYTPTPLPAAIKVTAPSVTPPKGTTEQLAAAAGFGDGTNSDVTSQVSWTSSNPAAATVSPTGVLTAVAVGSTTVTSTLYGVSGSLVVTVAPPALTTISVTEAASSLPDRVSEPLAATGTYTDGSSANLTNLVTWSSAKSAVATVAASGQVSAVGRGPVLVTATLGAVTGSTTITSLAPVLLLLVQPPLSSFAAGQTEQLQSRALLTDGTSYPATALTVWGVLPGSPVVVSPSGVASSPRIGLGIVTATLGSSFGLALVVVTAH